MVSGIPRSLEEELLRVHKGSAPLLPSTARVTRFADMLLGLLFPHFSEQALHTPERFDGAVKSVMGELRSALEPLAGAMKLPVDATAQSFLVSLPDMYASLRLDAEAIHRGDPAAESVDEVISAYPGFLAIAMYRVAHEFCRMGVPIFPRILTEIAHRRTGVDIHPGASIGRSFFIDHGTGIVIGETTVIGDNVKLYQGVTLGALSVDKTLSHSKRHPTIQDNVVIYSNATILGGETTIGHDSVIGGNVWLTESVTPYSIVYHKSEIRVRDARETAAPPETVQHQ